MNEKYEPRRVAWSIHALTASGVVVGLLGLVAVSEGRPREALMWIIAAIVLDGLDGPLARRINCREVLPEMDGYVLDLVVDFVTCVVLPAMFVLQRVFLGAPRRMVWNIAAYGILFVICGSAYLVAWVVMHLLVPKFALIELGDK